MKLLFRNVISAHYGKALDEEAMWRKAVYYLETDPTRSRRYRGGRKPQIQLSKHDEYVRDKQKHITMVILTMVNSTIMK